GDLVDLAVVGAGQREQPDLVEPAGGQSPLDHVADRGDAALTDRPGDHAGLAEPAAPGAATEDLHTEPLVHRLGHRHDGLARVLPGVQVHHGVLGHAVGRLRTVRRGPNIPAV